MLHYTTTLMCDVPHCGNTLEMKVESNVRDSPPVVSLIETVIGDRLHTTYYEWFSMLGLIICPRHGITIHVTADDPPKEESTRKVVMEKSDEPIEVPPSSVIELATIPGTPNYRASSTRSQTLSSRVLYTYIPTGRS